MEGKSFTQNVAFLYVYLAIVLAEEKNAQFLELKNFLSPNYRKFDVDCD